MPTRTRIGLALLLTAILVAGVVDLALDDPESWLSGHVIYELLLIAAALGGAAWLWVGWWRSEREVRLLRRSVAERQAERDAWRADAERALAGFAAAVGARFERWHLTPAEREVALGLLKGKSHKEIAAATGRSERTVRQHAIAVYQKSGLSGRAELAGFFLDDLMLPGPRTESPPLDEDSFTGP